MMGKRKLAEIKADVAALLSRLPGRSPEEWLDKEIASAKGERDRDVQTLEALCAALESGVRKVRKSKGQGRAARR